MGNFKAFIVLAILSGIVSFSAAQLPKIPQIPQIPQLQIPEAVQQKFNAIEQMQSRIRNGVRRSGQQLRTGGALLGGGVALNIIGTIVIAASPSRLRIENGVARSSLSAGQATGIVLSSSGLVLDVAGIYYLFKAGNTMKKTFNEELTIP